MTAVLVLLRAPDVQQARLFFVAIMTFITFCTPFHGRSYALSYLSRGILWYGVGGVGFGLCGSGSSAFPASSRAATGSHPLGDSSRPSSGTRRGSTT